MRSHWPDLVKWTLILAVVLAALWAVAQLQWTFFHPGNVKVTEVLQEQAQVLSESADSVGSLADNRRQRADSVSEDRDLIIGELEHQLAEARKLTEASEKMRESLADSVSSQRIGLKNQIRRQQQIIATQDSAIARWRIALDESNRVNISFRTEMNLRLEQIDHLTQENGILREQAALHRKTIEYYESRNTWYRRPEIGFLAGVAAAGAIAVLGS